MKLLFLTGISMIMIGCGGSGGGSSSPNSAPPDIGAGLTCKSLYSVWTSDSDLEQWDFTQFSSGQVVSDYHWTTANGTSCGVVNEFNSRTMTAQMVSRTGDTIHPYEVNLVYSDNPFSPCDTYNGPGSVQNRYGWLIIDMPSCGQLEICLSYSPWTCKTFH